MNRIDALFESYRAEGKKAFVGFLTAGDPDMTQSEKAVRAALDNGVDVLELGVPFSDPTADGPTIQEAGQRALKAGTHLRDVLDLTRRIRADYPDTPIILFGYANPFFNYGYEKLCSDAAKAGADGFLVVDLPYEEADELRVHLKANDLHFVPLIAPTTPAARKKQISDHSSGFIYYIMVTGVTGTRDTVAENIDQHIAELREASSLPIAVGFGISNGEQAALAAQNADGVVVGSALVKAALAGTDTLTALVKEIKAAIS
jgi:tryptophan synthase alpha chain